MINETKNNDSAVMSGEDGAFIDILEMGGTGTRERLGEHSEACKIFVQLYEAFQKGEKKSATISGTPRGITSKRRSAAELDSARHAFQQPAVPPARERP